MIEEYTGEDIVKKWGLPRSMCSCPNCGQIYGHHHTKVEITVELCSACMNKIGMGGTFISAEEFIGKIKSYV